MGITLISTCNSSPPAYIRIPRQKTVRDDRRARKVARSLRQRRHREEGRRGECSRVPSVGMEWNGEDVIHQEVWEAQTDRHALNFDSTPTATVGSCVPQNGGYCKGRENGLSGVPRARNALLIGGTKVTVFEQRHSNHTKIHG